MLIDKRYYNRGRYHGGALKADAIVLHHTAGHKAGDLAVLSGATKRGVSIHYYVAQDGTVYPMVPLTERAWHAGVSFLGGRWSLNSWTVGVELENLGREAYTLTQLMALDAVIALIDSSLGRAVPIYSHAEVAWPRGRKVDPGPQFPLGAYKLYRRHLAPVAPTPKPSAKPKPPVKPILALGSRNSWVKRVQAHIGARCDGVFGQQTLRLLKRYQKKHGLVADGVAGPKTYAHMGI
jgi:N-acetyl-anhydromuramyl-L-alanine amidase AmpD